MYIVDEFSPYEDPDEEAAKRRAAAVVRPAVASPPPDVTTPAPAAAPTVAPAADPAASVAADSVAPNPNPDSNATPSGAAAQTWSDTVRNANAKQSELGNNAISAMEQYRQRIQAIQERKDALQQQRQGIAAPIAARDTAGKVLDQYKPSFAQRLLRGVQAIQRGGVLGAIDPRAEGLPGYGSPNDQYFRDEGRRQQQLAGLDAGITAADKDATDAFSTAKGLAAEARSTAGVYKDINAGATAQQGAETATAKLPIDQQNAFNASPDGMAQRASMVSAAQWKTRNQVADQMKLKGNTRTLFLANGRLPDPRQATEGEIKVAQATAAWHRDNPGKQPTLADINEINQSVAGRAAMAGGDGTTLDPSYEAQAQRIAAADNPMLPQNSRSPINNAVMKRVFQINPGLTQGAYVTKQNFKTKGDSNNMVSLGTVVSHAQRALENSQKIGHNPLINHPGFQLPGAAAQDAAYADDRKFVVGEVGKLIKNGILTESETKDMLANLDSPRQGIRDAALKELTVLAGGKAKALFQKYKTGTGSPLPLHEYFDQETEKYLRDNGITPDGDTGGVEPTTPAAAPSGGNIFKFDDYPVAQ